MWCLVKRRDNFASLDTNLHCTNARLWMTKYMIVLNCQKTYKQLSTLNFSVEGIAVCVFVFRRSRVPFEDCLPYLIFFFVFPSLSQAINGFVRPTSSHGRFLWHNFHLNFHSSFVPTHPRPGLRLWMSGGNLLSRLYDFIARVLTTLFFFSFFHLGYIQRLWNK